MLYHATKDAATFEEAVEIVKALSYENNFESYTFFWGGKTYTAHWERLGKDGFKVQAQAD